MKNNMNKKQAEKILATVVMGMNLVNAAAPVAALAAAEQPAQPLPKPAGSEAAPLDYALLPQLADIVDRAIFARAQAASNYDGNASVAVMSNGDTQIITAGQSGTVSTMSGGGQVISKGSGTISTMSGGEQLIYDGNGTVIDMNRGTQAVLNGGTATISTMSGGKQAIAGLGTVGTMIGGTQYIISDGKGTVSTMSGGTQSISSGAGTISTMDSGEQGIYAGSGTISTMHGGSQTISGGTGTIGTMNNGRQDIGDGSGTVGTMNDGLQSISVGSGIIGIMNSGGQSIRNAGVSGIISTMNDGEQYIRNSGAGTVGTMNSGLQAIDNYGAGTVEIMIAGEQGIQHGGTGTVGTMSGGKQTIEDGTGTVSTMFGGTQIAGNETGTVYTMSGGTQFVGDGTGAVSTMHSGVQLIVRGSGTGTVSTMHSGVQLIMRGSGTGTVSTMSGGVQFVAGGGKGTVSALNGGTQIVSDGGTAVSTTINGGTQIVSNNGSISGVTLKAGLQQVYDGTKLNDITFAGGTQEVMNGAAVSGMQVASGLQVVSSGGTAVSTELNGGNMQLASGGIVSGLTMSGGSMELESIDGGSFAINGTLTANNAVINMTDSSVTRAVTPAYESLTIDKLSGSGTTFIMDTDLAGETNGDKVIINDAEVGKHYVQIKDLSGLNGTIVTEAHNQLLITDNSGKLTFEGKAFNAGGLWDIDPTLAKGDTLGLSASDWYLTKVAKTVNNDTGVLLDAADNSYAMWRNTNDSLRSRLGALASGSAQADGIWARTQAGRFSGNGYEGRYNLYQLGFDQQFNRGSIYGGAIDYGDGSGSYDPGSGKDKLRSFSLYGIWTCDSGTYTNVTARAGNFSTDLESYGDFPDKASYKQHAYSISVEYGKRFDLERGLFFEPNAQFTLGRLGSISYTTDRGANGHIDGMNSAIGRIGFVMGQKITNGSDIYLKADLLHEFAGERDLVLTSDAGGTNDILTKHNDYGDTWFELGLGGNVKLSKAGNLYGEVVRGFGGEINKKWQLNAGIRFTF